MKGTISRLSSGVLLVTAIALAGMLGAGNASAGPPPIELQFNPTFDYELTTLVAGANPDLQINLGIEDPDAYFSAAITFVPDATGLGGCPANDPTAFSTDCADDGIPNGAIVGEVVADSTLGLANGACNSPIENITFSMMEATTDMSEQVMFEDDPGDADIQGEQFEDADGNGLPDGVDKYPAYLTRLIRNIPFGLDGSEPLQPIIRTYGQTVVASTDVSTQFLIMEPGIMVNGLQLDPADGIPIVTVTQNTGDPGAVPVPGNITDQCSTFAADARTFGITKDNPDTSANEGGLEFIKSPAAGDYTVNVLLFSNRDEDNDGIENQVDPCPASGNPDSWDPRNPSSPGDNDQDGLPNVCDPSPDANNTDQDGDQFLNRGDNCPVLVNALQEDADRDGIGNVCDPDPAAPSAIIIPFPLTFPDTTVGMATVTDAHQGDNDCDDDTDAVDALFSLRLVAGLGVAACVNNAGDVNCDGEKDTIDALQIQRFVASLEVFQEPGCTPIEDVLT